MIDMQKRKDEQDTEGEELARRRALSSENSLWRISWHAGCTPGARMLMILLSYSTPAIFDRQLFSRGTRHAVSPRFQCEFAPDGQRNIVAAAAVIEERCAGRFTENGHEGSIADSSANTDLEAFPQIFSPTRRSGRSTSTTSSYLKRTKLRLLSRIEKIVRFSRVTN